MILFRYLVQHTQRISKFNEWKADYRYVEHFSNSSKQASGSDLGREQHETGGIAHLVKTILGGFIWKERKRNTPWMGKPCLVYRQCNLQTSEHNPL